MPSPNQQDLPLITVGVIALNRDWIIGKMFASLQKQTYPHDKLFVLVVDGESKDNTVKVAQEALSNSDFGGYEVMVKKSTIPEARNICIQNMRGDFLLFWDSDVIMEPTAIVSKLETLREEGADMLTSDIPNVTISSLDEIDAKWSVWASEHPKKKEVISLNAAGSGNLLISKKVLEKVAFDPDYTFYEDYDFTIRATDLGFKLMETKNVTGFDINTNIAYSDLSVDMSVKDSVRGLRKKGIIQAQTITAGSASVSRGVAKFFLANKRYIFYVVHVPALVLLAIGAVFLNIWLVLIPLLYFLLYAAMHIKKKGFAKGANAFARSFTVGIPTTYATLYYCLKLLRKRPEKFTVKL